MKNIKNEFQKISKLLWSRVDGFYCCTDCDEHEKSIFHLLIDIKNVFCVLWIIQPLDLILVQVLTICRWCYIQTFMRFIKFPYSLFVYAVIDFLMIWLYGLHGSVHCFLFAQKLLTISWMNRLFVHIMLNLFSLAHIYFMNHKSITTRIPNKTTTRCHFQQWAVVTAIHCPIKQQATECLWAVRVIKQ